MSRGRAIPEALRSGPFTAAEARHHGLSANVLTSDRFWRLYAGVYACRELPNNHQLWVRAAAKILPGDAVFSHHTAARLRGVPVPDDGLVHASLVDPTAHRLRRRHLRVHRVASYEYEMLDRRRVSSPCRIFVELAESLGLVDLVVAGDHLLRHRMAGLGELRSMLRTTGKRRGIRLARRALELARPRVDSPMETRLRLLLVLAGLPHPKVNADVEADDDGDPLWFRPDLVYPEYRVAIEYDGELHRTRPEKWRRDQTLRRRLFDVGWKVLAFNAADVYRSAPTTLGEVHRVLRERGHPDVPSATSDEVWQHFDR